MYTMKIVLHFTWCIQKKMILKYPGKRGFLAVSLLSFVDSYFITSGSGAVYDRCNAAIF